MLPKVDSLVDENWFCRRFILSKLHSLFLVGVRTGFYFSSSDTQLRLSSSLRFISPGASGIPANLAVKEKTKTKDTKTVAFSKSERDKLLMGLCINLVTASNRSVSKERHLLHSEIPKTKTFLDTRIFKT